LYNKATTSIYTKKEGEIAAVSIISSSSSTHTYTSRCVIYQAWVVYIYIVMAWGMGEEF